jgi:myo-inositol-1(or 4)-monophosphatase
LATGFPYSDYSQLTEYLQLFEDLLKNSRGLRRLGSAAVDLAYVACGRFDAFYEYSLHIWDIAAGIIIVQEAGGKVSDFKGGNNYLSGNEIIASNTSIHNELEGRIQRYF